MAALIFVFGRGCQISHHWHRLTDSINQSGRRSQHMKKDEIFFFFLKGNTSQQLFCCCRSNQRYSGHSVPVPVWAGLSWPHLLRWPGPNLQTPDTVRPQNLSGPQCEQLWPSLVHRCSALGLDELFSGNKSHNSVCDVQGTWTQLVWAQQPPLVVSWTLYGCVSSL